MYKRIGNGGSEEEHGRYCTEYMKMYKIAFNFHSLRISILDYCVLL